MGNELEYFGFEDFRDIRNKLIALTIFRHALTDNKYDLISLHRDFGLTENEISFLLSLFPELKAHRKPAPHQLQKVLRDLEAEDSNIRAKLLQEMELWIFPKWRGLIGATSKGTFEGRPVREILWAVVTILVPSMRSIWLYRMLSGEECIGIFGLGGYLVEFIPDRGQEPTRFSLPIDGVIMERHLYETAIESPKRLSVPRFSEYLREHLIRIPLAELVRNRFAAKLFAPTIRKISHWILDFLKVIRKLRNSYTLDDSRILSAWHGSMNKLLVTRNRYESMLENELLKGVPGVLGYEGILDKLEEIPIVKDPSIHIKSKRTTWLRFAIAGYDLLERLIGIRKW